jgi:hypothetical protein
MRASDNGHDGVVKTLLNANATMDQKDKVRH